MKKVYIAMSADFIHHGHMNIIEKARSLGTIIVGLLTDKAIAEHKRSPYLNYKQRKQIINNIGKYLCTFKSTNNYPTMSGSLYYAY